MVSISSTWWQLICTWCIASWRFHRFSSSSPGSRRSAWPTRSFAPFYVGSTLLALTRDYSRYLNCGLGLWYHYLVVEASIKAPYLTPTAGLATAFIAPSCMSMLMIPISRTALQDCDMVHLRSKIGLNFIVNIHACSASPETLFQVELGQWRGSVWHSGSKLPIRMYFLMSWLPLTRRLVAVEESKTAKALFIGPSQSGL